MYDGGVLALLALTLAGTASPAVDRAEARWLPFFQARPTEAAIVAAFGKPDLEDRTEDAERNLFFKRTPPFAGGLDAWVDPAGKVLDMTFYVAGVARIWTRDAKLRAARLPSEINMADVLARYGTPDHDKAGKGRRIGVRRLIYEDFSSGATRSVTFSSLPFTGKVHAIAVSWE